MNIDRRTFAMTLAGWMGSTALVRGSRAGRAMAITPARRGAAAAVTLTDVDGLLVGHHTREDAPTGCTAIVAPTGATGGVSVRGSAPGTRELALLDPQNSVDVVHAICLSGGSAFGLAAAEGVVQHLSETGIGLPFAGRVIPIVPAAILFDLGVSGGVSPDAGDGRAAAEAATGDPVQMGNVGAGAGASVGKIFGGRFAMKGGLGSAGLRFPDGTVVAALAAVNARGDVVDPATGRIVAGARTESGDGLRDTRAALLAGARPEPEGEGQNTTIGVVATNLKLDKAACTRLAGVAHDGLARAIVPAHTRWDGDTLFSLATGTRPRPTADAELDRLDVAAAEVMTAAILAAVGAAESLPDLPSARDLGTWPTLDRHRPGD